MVPYLEKQINEMNRKIDEIHHRMSMIQFMVDSHERTLKELGNTNKPGQKNSSRELSDASTLPKPFPLISEGLIGEPDITPPDNHKDTPRNEDNPLTPELLYNRALADYKKGAYNTAISTFNAFAEKYPKHELADNALYWKGECYYSQKNYTEAIMAFKKVIETYPEGSKIPDALLKAGYSYLALDSKENARLFLKKVVINFPFSPAGTKAEEMLKHLN